MGRQAAGKQATSTSQRRVLEWPAGRMFLLLCPCIFFAMYIYSGNDDLATSMVSFRASSFATSASATGSVNQRVEGFAVSKGRRTQAAIGVPARARKVECGPCRLKVTSREAAMARQGTATIVVPITNGFGRTGNFVLSVGEAIASARRCGHMLALPEIDARNAFTFEESYAVYDFVDDVEHRANPIGLPPAYCSDLVNSTAYALAKKIYRASSLSPVDVEIDQCVRWYLGLCRPGFCGSLPEELKDTLVVHIRQGDIFKANYNNDVHELYWQPPLDYYLAAMTFKTWDAIWVLSEPARTDFSPSFLMLETLADRGLLPAPARFMQYVTGRTWAEDLQTLLCAPNVVTSRSSLEAVVRIGFSSQVFGLTCLRHTDGPAVSVYQIPTTGRNGEQYAPVLGHTNSPEEWVQILLHRLPQDVVQHCNKSE